VGLTVTAPVSATSTATTTPPSPPAGDPAMTVVYPNGGEALIAGETHPLQWTWDEPNKQSAAGYLYLAAYDGLAYRNVLNIADVTHVIGANQYSWRVPDGYGGSAYRILAGTNNYYFFPSLGGSRQASDYSNANFTINPAAPVPIADVTAPVISNIQASNITATSAVITWTTDEAADSQIEYGLTASYGFQTPLDANRVTGHSVVLTGLAASTAYQYLVKSKDAAGNPATATGAVTTGPAAVSCVGPYHVLASDGRCVWSCGAGTQPDDPNNSSGQCVCQSGYTESGTDSFGRRVCTQATVYALTIRGRVTDAITRQPVTGSNMYIWNWKGSTRRDFYLQSDGSFLINLTADDVANANATYVNAVHNQGRACFDQSSFSLVKTASGSVDYVRVQEYVTGYPQTTRSVTPSGTEVNIGDFLVWPVTGFSLTSDIPVKFSATYANGSGGGGNINYRTSHGFSTLYPVNIGTRITLTDQAGSQYVSSYATYGLSQHCSQVALNFANGQFSWNPQGALSFGTNNRQEILAAMLKALEGIRQKLNALVR